MPNPWISSMPAGLTDSRKEPVVMEPAETALPQGPDSKPDRILILIPAFNEASRIGQVLDDIQKEVPNIPILVIDDGSRDSTADVAREHGASVITLPYNNGYGVALQTGFRYAHHHDYTLVVQMDADGQHDAAEIPRLIHAVQKQNLDVVVGSRFLESGQYRTPGARKLGIWIFSLLASIFIHQRVTDPTSGFQAVRGRAIRFVASDQFPPDYPDADSLILLHRCGFRLGEVPVRMHPSPPNKSMHHGTRAVYYVFKMFLSIFVTLLRQKPGPF
jgi:glycosyltransferase involved in cell wall biosynthesis